MSRRPPALIGVKVCLLELDSDNIKDIIFSWLRPTLRFMEKSYISNDAMIHPLWSATPTGNGTYKIKLEADGNELTTNSEATLTSPAVSLIPDAAAPILHGVVRNIQSIDLPTFLQIYGQELLGSRGQLSYQAWGIFNFRLFKRFRLHYDMLKRDTNEMPAIAIVYHGVSKSEVADQIMTNGFSVAHNTKSVWGAGNYFTTNVETAIGYGRSGGGFFSSSSGPSRSTVFVCAIILSSKNLRSAMRDEILTEQTTKNDVRIVDSAMRGRASNELWMIDIGNKGVLPLFRVEYA